MSRRKDRKVERERVRKQERTLTMEQYMIEYLEDYFIELGYSEIADTVSFSHRTLAAGNRYDIYKIVEGFVIFNTTKDTQEWEYEWLLNHYLLNYDRI